MSTCHCTGVKFIEQWSVLNKTAEGMEHRPANAQLTAIISRGLRPVKINPVKIVLTPVPVDLRIPKSNLLQGDEEKIIYIYIYTTQRLYDVKM